MAHRTDPTTTEGVRQFLSVCFGVTDAEIDEALAKPENAEEVRAGISLGSFVDFPSEHIAAREGWVMDEEAYNEHYDPDEEYD